MVIYDCFEAFLTMAWSENKESLMRSLRLLLVSDLINILDLGEKIEDTEVRITESPMFEIIKIFKTSIT